MLLSRTSDFSSQDLPFLVRMAVYAIQMLKTSVVSQMSHFLLF